jgi:protein TonB
MAARLLDNRSRLIGLAGAVLVHVVGIAVIVLFAPDYVPLPEVLKPALVAIDLTPPPPPAPPPPPDDVEEGASAPPSRGATEAPSPPPPPRPLAVPTPAQAAVDPGSGQASGLGNAPGNAAGQGGEGSGSGAGGSGNGRGAGRVTPPARIAGGFTGADYRAVRLPRGAMGSVRVSFRVRSDGIVDRCVVTDSSGYREFADATCPIIQRRFRYEPARDGSGRPIDWEIRTDFLWAPT